MHRTPSRTKSRIFGSTCLPPIQAELKAEDSVAWNQVVGVLLLIISIGLVLAVGTALFSGKLSVHL